MSGQELAGPVLVGYAVLGPGEVRHFYVSAEEAHYFRGFGGTVKQVYTLPDYLAPSAPSLAVRLRWFLAGAGSAALVCLAALALGGAV